MPLFGGSKIKKLLAARDVDGLLEALGHDRSSVRAEAARALGEIADLRALEPLVSLVETLAKAPNRDKKVMAAAADAVRSIGGLERLLPMLQPLVTSFIEGVRRRLTPAMRTAVDGRPESERVRAMGGMVKLEHGSEVAAIGAFGSSGFERLAAAIDDEADWLVRWAIAAALLEIDDPGARRLIQAKGPQLRGEPAEPEKGPTVTLWVQVEDEEAARNMFTDPKVLGERLALEGTPEATAFLNGVLSIEVGSTISISTEPNRARGGFDVTLTLKPKEM